MATNDELIDHVRFLEGELTAIRDRQGRLKVGTQIIFNGDVGVVTFVGDLEKSYTGRQPYIVAFPEKMVKTGAPQMFWADETQFGVEV